MRKENQIRIEELLLRQRNNDRIAIKQGKRSISYATWHKEAERIKKRVENMNTYNYIHSIGIFISNSIEYALAYFAGLYCKKVIVPISTKAKAEEIKRVLEYQELEIILTVSCNNGILTEAIDGINRSFEIYNVDTDDFKCISKGINDVIYRKDMTHIWQNGTDEDVAVMLHTSGSSAEPKRVMLTHKNLICNIESNIASLGITDKDTVLIALPMNFGYCNTAQFLTHLYLGGKIVILENIFTGKSFFEVVQKEKITMFTAVPTMLKIINEYSYYARYNFNELRYICFGGAEVSKILLKELILKFPSVGFVQTYGQTECSPRVTALLPQYAYEKIGSVGKPIPGVEIALVDKNNRREVIPYEVGEIVVKGLNVMKGYFKREDLTKEVIQKGWLHTGDLGYLDEDGFLYLTGRLKNVIISGGINIYPEEIEQVIKSKRYVKEAYVYGLPDDYLGEVPAVDVVMTEEGSIKALREYCEKCLSRYKIPRKIKVVTCIQHTYNGKIKRR